MTENRKTQQYKCINCRACAGTLDRAEANTLRLHPSEWREPPVGCSLDRAGYTRTEKAREATDTLPQYTLSLAFGSCRPTRPVKAGSRNGAQRDHLDLLPVAHRTQAAPTTCQQGHRSPNGPFLSCDLTKAFDPQAHGDKIYHYKPKKSYQFKLCKKLKVAYCSQTIKGPTKKQVGQTYSHKHPVCFFYGDILVPGLLLFLMHWDVLSSRCSPTGLPFLFLRFPLSQVIFHVYDYACYEYGKINSESHISQPDKDCEAGEKVQENRQEDTTSAYIDDYGDWLVFEHQVLKCSPPKEPWYSLFVRWPFFWFTKDPWYSLFVHWPLLSSRCSPAGLLFLLSCFFLPSLYKLQGKGNQKNTDKECRNQPPKDVIASGFSQTEKTYNCQKVDLSAHLFTYGFRCWSEEIANKYTRCRDQHQHAPNEEKKIARDCKQQTQTYHHSKVSQISPRRSRFFAHSPVPSSRCSPADLLLLLSRVLLVSLGQDENNYSCQHAYERSYDAQPLKNVIVDSAEHHSKKQRDDKSGPRKGHNRSYRLVLVLLLALVHSSLFLCHCETLVYTNDAQLALSNGLRALASGADQVTRTALVAFPESEVCR